MKLKKLPAQPILTEQPQPSAPDPVPVFDTTLACAVGGATFGSIGGLPGLFAGAIIGGLVGFYYRRRDDAC